jgi:predicted RNase H-like nuclease/ppGpp synthetase/RelA/SpoT-type nucleotidyltranferase
MYFVGIDLAWGTRQPTGVAVLDDGGRLVHVSARTTDESIVAAIGDYVRGDCLVAIDAPLVVTNATGSRPAEAALNRDFSRFDAGAHPANTTKPEFRDTPRGRRLADGLGLDIDPHSRRRRRAIEVYPHPATVAVFGLGRTLKYKNKKGRSVPGLRAELLRLIGLLESLTSAVPPLRLTHDDTWRALVAGVEAAERKSELRRAEDQVDAVVCAYVALFAERRPDATTTYGDLAEGYIVTPTLPDGLTPEPRKPRASGTQQAVQIYATRRPRLAEATGRFTGLVTTLLDDAGINYLTIASRTKTVSSFAAKADRSEAGRALYRDPLTEITDQIGLRVITYVQSDVTAVVELLANELTILDDRDMGMETASEGRWGYASRHLLVAVDDARDNPPEYAALSGLSAQVQIRTVLQHAWAEFEHDIRYKGSVPEEHVSDLDRRFALAAGLLELADREFTTIRDRLRANVVDRRPTVDEDDPRIGATELASFLAGQFEDASWSRTDHYAWISGLLLELGITSLDELALMLSSIDTDSIDARMDYRYPAGAVRRLDDALLAVNASTYVNLHGNAHRQDLLRARLEKLRGESTTGG